MISDCDRRCLVKMWKGTKGEAWEPGNPKHELFDRLIAAGYLKRVDGRCGFERFKESMIAWTNAGREAMEASE